MISLKVLSTAAVMALALPLAMPTASFAGPPHGARSAGGNFHPGGGNHHHGGGVGPGLAAGIAGAVIGGAIASQGYYGGPGYYAADPGYDNGYYDDGGAVAVVPGPGDEDGTSYCMQRYRSYDPRSGTYLGNDGYRHPCP
jgi:hypothetical protein